MTTEGRIARGLHPGPGLDGERPMNGRVCSSCRHSHEADVNPADLRAPRSLLCRRLPPVPSIVGLDQAGRATTVSLWPTVKAGDSCGEWSGDSLRPVA